MYTIDIIPIINCPQSFQSWDWSDRYFWVLQDCFLGASMLFSNLDWPCQHHKSSLQNQLPSALSKSELQSRLLVQLILHLSLDQWKRRDLSLLLEEKCPWITIDGLWVIKIMALPPTPYNATPLKLPKEVIFNVKEFQNPLGAYKVAATFLSSACLMLFGQTFVSF